MAITLQSSNNSSGTSNIALNVSSADGLAIVVLSAFNNSSAMHSAVSHNGKAFTKIFENSSGTYRTQGWLLINPDVGSYPVVFSGSGGSTNTNNVAAVLTNVDPANPVADSNTAGTSGTSHSVSTTVSKENSLVIGIASIGLTSNQPSWATNGSGQTQLHKEFLGTFSGYWTIAAYKANQPVGANSLNFNTTFSYNVGMGVMVLNEYTTTLLQPSETLHQFTSTSPILATDKLYSYGFYETLPADDATLANLFTPEDYEAVETDNGVYFSNVSASYNVILFKKKHSNSVDKIDVSWNGKSNKNASTHPIYLQIYNYAAGQWETIASNNTTLANNEFTLNGSAVGSDYYTTGNWFAVRGYQ